jgi:predicted nucleic acid-binding protein
MLRVADHLIAGICLAPELPLLTRNVAHLDRVDGLVLVPVR